MTDTQSCVKREQSQSVDSPMEELLCATTAAVATQRFRQLFGMLEPDNEGADPEQVERSRQQRYRALLDAFRAIEPQDEIESQIGLQLVATHNLTMKLASRANQATEILQFNTALNGMAKLQRSYVALLEALHRHRGKRSEQRIVVERVTVEAGGQAVVGAVDARRT